MASGNIKDIKRRIKSVQSTMQITKAMELVASSKMRHAKERALGARPYFNALYQTITHLAGATRGSESVYTRPREVKNSLYIVIAGDRGLAGGYNANLFKLAAAEMQGKQAQVITIGKKAQEHYAKRPVTVAADYPGIAETMRISDTHPIVEDMLKLFREGKVDEVFLCYTEFISPLQQEVPQAAARALRCGGGSAQGRSCSDRIRSLAGERVRCSHPGVPVRRAVRRGSRKLLLRAVGAPHGNGGCVG